MHYEISNNVDAQNVKPLSQLFTRTTEEGDIGIVCFLIGSEFNNDQSGEMIEFEKGNVIESIIEYISGKLYIYGKPEIDEEQIEVGTTHSTFTYLFPGTEIFGHMGLRNKSAVYNLLGQQYKQYGRTIFEDLNSGNQLIIELKIGEHGPVLSFIEKIDDTEYVLGETILEDYDIFYDLKILDQGVTSFGYTIDQQQFTNVFKGDLNFHFSGCKISHTYYTDYNQNENYLTIDFIRIDYDTIFTSYKSDIDNKPKANTKMYDIVKKIETVKGVDIETVTTTQIRSKDHKVNGNIQIANGIIRSTFYDDKIVIEGYDKNSTEEDKWKNLGEVTPSNNSKEATTLIDYKIKTLSRANIIMELYYDTGIYNITLRKGMSWIKIKPDNKELIFNPEENEFAISSKDNKLVDYNIAHATTIPNNSSIVLNRLSEDDNNLKYMNDNWLAFYGLPKTTEEGVPLPSEPCTFIASYYIPIELDLIKTETLDKVVTKWVEPNTYCIGFLPTETNVAFLNNTNYDKSVKWRANTCIFDFKQVKRVNTK